MPHSTVQHSIFQEVPREVLAVLEEIKRDPDIFNEDPSNIGYRPLRPDEINIAFMPATRVYTTTAITAAYFRILNAATDVTVPANSVYVSFGWYVLEDPTQPLGQDSVLQVLLNNVLAQEVAAYVVQTQENHELILLNQVVVAEENNVVRWQIKCPTNGPNAAGIIYPFAFRIGRKSTIGVT